MQANNLIITLYSLTLPHPSYFHHSFFPLGQRRNFKKISDFELKIYIKLKNIAYGPTKRLTPLPMEKVACVTNNKNVYLTDPSSSTMSMSTASSMTTSKPNSADINKVASPIVLMLVLILMNLNTPF